MGKWENGEKPNKKKQKYLENKNKVCKFVHY